MKKILFLFTSVIILAACSSDDDASEAEDPIVGTWYLVEINNFPGGDLTLTDCNRESYIVFNADNSTLSQYFADDEEEDGCETVHQGEGTWQNEGEEIYSFPVYLEGIGTQTLEGTAEFSGDQFTFYPSMGASSNTNIVFEHR